MGGIVYRYRKHLMFSQLLKRLGNELALEYNSEMAVIIPKTCMKLLPSHNYLLNVLIPSKF